jgi:hypothetical protein
MNDDTYQICRSSTRLEPNKQKKKISIHRPPSLTEL